MSKASDIITRARHIMNDPDKDRWTDDRLLLLVSEGQQDIAMKTSILQDKYSVVVQDNVADYVLPAYVYKIIKAVWRDEEIPLTTYDEMNTIASNWIELTTEGDVSHVIYSYRNKRNIRIYPIPKDISAVKLAEYSTVQDAIVALDAEYGVLDYIDSPASAETTYGIADYILQNGVSYPFSMDDLVGIVGEIVDNSIIGDKLLYIYYVKVPVALTTTDDDLELDEEFDRMLSLYVAGNALRDDNDASNLNRGNLLYKEYVAELALIKKDSVHRFTSNLTLKTRYNGGFN